MSNFAHKLFFLVSFPLLFSSISPFSSGGRQTTLGGGSFLSARLNTAQVASCCCIVYVCLNRRWVGSSWVTRQYLVDIVGFRRRRLVDAAVNQWPAFCQSVRRRRLRRAGSARKYCHVPALSHNLSSDWTARAGGPRCEREEYTE